MIASRHPAIATGEMLFGYFPMATHLVIEATDVKKASLRDGAAHRQGVSPVYNAYTRVSDNPAFAARQGDYQALLRPLFMLSFLVDDFLADNDFFGAKAVILSSASSKTAFGLAWLLHTHRKPMRVIGLTSPGNAAFVRSLGCYDEVVTYDGIADMPPDPRWRSSTWPAMRPCANGCTAISASAWPIAAASGSRIRTSRRAKRPCPAPGRRGSSPPTRSASAPRNGAPAGSMTGSAQCGRGSPNHWDRNSDITTGRGRTAVQQVYLDTLQGRVKPQQAHMLSLAE